MPWSIHLLLSSIILGSFWGGMRSGGVYSTFILDAQPVTDVTLEYQFGSSLQINAVISQIADYSSFALILQPDGQSSRTLSFVPESNGQVIIFHDLEVDPLKPFARVYYWFELVNLDGSSVTTPSYWFDYLDNRYTWQTSETELFQISWVDGDAAFGQKLQKIARDGLEEATTLLPVTPELPIRIYVYPSLEDMQSALTFSGQTWTAGHTSPDIGVILVSIDNPSTELIEMERQIPHEIMHILEYQLTGDHYGSIPVWLSEGLATSVELYPNPDLQRALNDAQTNGTILPFSSLCEGFSSDANQAQLAYAQSVSFIKFINGRFGSSIFPNLLENAASGLTCENLVQTTLAVSLDQLQQDWMAAVEKEPTLDFSFETLLPLMIAAGILLTVIVILMIRTRHHQVRK